MQSWQISWQFDDDHLEKRQFSIGCSTCHSTRNARGFWPCLCQILCGFWKTILKWVWGNWEECLYHPHNSVQQDIIQWPTSTLSCGAGLLRQWPSETKGFRKRKHAWISGTELGETCQYEFSCTRSGNTKKQTTYSLVVSLKMHLSVKTTLKKQVMVKTKDNKQGGKHPLLSKVGDFKVNDCKVNTLATFCFFTPMYQ